MDKHLIKNILFKLNGVVLNEAEARLTKAEDLLAKDNLTASNQEAVVAKQLVSLATIISEFNKSLDVLF